MSDIKSKLKELSEIFAPSATLYAVGGYVRDRLMGCKAYDIDICSKLRVEEVKNILLNTDFEVSDKNLRMGTVLISAGEFRAEYTAFRTESYNTASGEHSPKTVNFTDSLAIDARRRDFRCNAIYLDILRDEIVDPLGGSEDIKNKIIVTTDCAEKVFEADGLRILRLVRFASELGFEICEDTFRVAKLNAWRVKDIAVERIRDELCKIFTADLKHSELETKGAHLHGFRLLDELGLVDLLLPEVSALKGLQQKKQYHIYDAYEHSVKAFEISPPNLRWIALLHDVGKRIAYDNNFGESMRGHDEIGAVLADNILKRLRFANSERERTVKLVLCHMIDIKGDMSIYKLRRFAVEHCDIIDDLCMLKDIDAEASSGQKPKINRLRDVWQEIKMDGTPLKISDLKVNGNDLIALGIRDKDIGMILKELFDDTALDPTLNDRAKALQYVCRKRDKLLDKNNSR